MIKLAKKLLVILIVSVFMISMVAATAYAVNTPSDEKKVEHKEKKIKNYKIKWSANGGKIGTKKTVTTTVKKGSKVKLAKTPKRAGYSFQGWFSKKSGGKKITKNTKPTKSITYFAHWKKKPRVLNAEEKKLVGSWSLGSVSGGAYNYYTGAYLHATGIGLMKTFNADGSYNYVVMHNTAYSKDAMYFKGFWYMSGGTVYITGIQVQDSKDGGTTWSSWRPSATPNTSTKIFFGSDERGSYFEEGYESGEAKWRKS